MSTTSKNVTNHALTSTLAIKNYTLKCVLSSRSLIFCDDDTNIYICANIDMVVELNVIIYDGSTMLDTELLQVCGI